MKVSICITIFNEEESIEALLDSLKVQTIKPDEIVIVDGGSFDKTVDKIRNYTKQKIHLIVKKCTRSEGRNISIKSAKNNIIVMTDSGCVAKKNWLEEITKPFKDEDVEVVAGFYDMTGDSAIQKAASVYLGVLPKNFRNDYLPSTRSIAFKREVWKKVGGFSEALDDTAEDTIFNYNLVKNNVHISRMKNARVEWVMPSSVGEIYKKIFNYAKGDAKSRVLFFPNKRPNVAQYNYHIKNN